MKIEAQNRQIHRELGRLVEQQVLTSEQRAAISVEREVSGTVVAMEHMAILLAQARHECHSREDGTR